VKEAGAGHEDDAALLLRHVIDHAAASSASFALVATLDPCAPCPRSEGARLPSYLSFCWRYCRCFARGCVGFSWSSAASGRRLDTRTTGSSPEQKGINQ
jgi:hypothetical protein